MSERKGHSVNPCNSSNLGFLKVSGRAFLGNERKILAANLANAQHLDFFAV